MSGVYGPADERDSIAAVHRALDLGIDFFDTADVYGLGQNEEVLAVLSATGEIERSSQRSSASGEIRIRIEPG